MSYNSLTDDPDWGHKPEDDDFVVDNSYMEDMLKWSIDCVNREVPRHKHFERGYKYYESKFYKEALDEFLAGHNETNCPKCSTMVGIIIADKLWNYSRSPISSYTVASLDDNPVPYLQKGVSANLPEAMVALAIVYASPGKHHHESKVLPLMKKAAQLGHPVAIKAIAEHERARKGRLKRVMFAFAEATIEAVSEVIAESAGDMVESSLKRLFFK